jgi:DNA-directed RNA polymerase specialized sigma24 family protein
MSSPGSVTNWLTQLQAGDPAAAQKLWERYYLRLVSLARAKLQGAPRRMADEEDVALSAFDSFFRGAEQGRFPLLDDRDNLWRLLVTITARKAFDLARQERRQKRGGGAVLDEAALARPDEPDMDGIDRIAAQEPTPAFAVQVAEECQRLLARLTTPELRSIALWKMEGRTNEEIATELGCVARSVERKLWLIRNLWAKEGQS